MESRWEFRSKVRIREFCWDSWAEWTYRTIMADQPNIVAVDTETTGLGFYDTPFAATLTWRGPDGALKSGYFDLEADNREYRKHLLGGILANIDAWVFHNAKFDLQKLLLIGAITPQRIEDVDLHDTQTCYMLLDENQTKGLKDLAVRVLKYDDTITVEYKSGKKKGQTHEVAKEKYQLDAVRRKLGLTKDDGYHLLPRDVLIPYALRDTEFTLRLYEVLMPKLHAKKDPALLRLYADSMQLKRALLRMEADGFGLDVEYTQEKASEYGVRVMEKWDRVTTLVGDPDFNPRSPNQVKAAFARRGLHLEDTKAATLEKLNDELAQALLAYRDDFKIHTTYLLALLREQREGIIHPHFFDDGARTGRMSSGTASE